MSSAVWTGWTEFRRPETALRVSPYYLPIVIHSFSTHSNMPTLN